MKLLLEIFYLISRLVNVLSGGSFKEYYCARMWREGRTNRIIFLNWIFFYINPSEINHCKRVHDNDSKH